MSENEGKRIPVNIVGGPLGSGKTTVINHLMAQRPAHERWAVLVNEYGLVGLDGALLGDGGQSRGVDIREVAGGCICCSAGVMFEVSLVLLLRRRPDRLLIEPTGLATLSGIMDTFGREGICEAVDLRSVICLLDPSSMARHIARDETRDQVEAADILLASRSDIADDEQLDSFESWARSIFPPKRFVGRVEKGQVPLELLDLVTHRGASGRRPAPDHGAHPHSETSSGEGPTHEDEHATAEGRCDASRPIVQLSHRSTVASTIGFICWEGMVFDAEAVTRWLGELMRSPRTRRAKAVLRTSEGWLSFNLAEATKEIRPSGHRRDSRLELVLDGDSIPDPEGLERTLCECLSSSAPRVPPS